MVSEDKYVMYKYIFLFYIKYFLFLGMKGLYIYLMYVEIKILYICWILLNGIIFVSSDFERNFKIKKNS